MRDHGAEAFFEKKTLATSVTVEQKLFWKNKTLATSLTMDQELFTYR